MAASSNALAWRNHALELALRTTMSEGEQKEKAWIRDYADLFEMNQKQLDFTDEVLAQLHQKQREREQVEQHVKALQMELRKARQEREQAEREWQLKVQKMEIEAHEMKRNVEELVRFNILLRERQTQ